MFDEQETSSAPAAEPTQSAPAASEAPPIFDGTTPATDQHIPDRSPETSVLGPSALEAGKLTPIQSDVSAAMMSADAGELHEPTALKRILLATAIVAVIAAIAGGVWWFLNRSSGESQQPATASPSQAPAAVPVEKLFAPAASIDVDAPPPVPQQTEDATAEFQVAPQPTQKPSANPEPKSAPTPQPAQNVDTDKDGLNDAREVQLKTDPNNPDTDGDNLNDGAEVNIWQTDPHKKDTDGDGFPDGQEVMNGFNPKGPGKLQ